MFRIDINIIDVWSQVPGVLTEHIIYHSQRWLIVRRRLWLMFEVYLGINVVICLLRGYRRQVLNERILPRMVLRRRNRRDVQYQVYLLLYLFDYSWFFTSVTVCRLMHEFVWGLRICSLSSHVQVFWPEVFDAKRFRIILLLFFIRFRRNYIILSRLNSCIDLLLSKGNNCRIILRHLLLIT